ncbi:MAG TPA: DUF1800 domain-containing protein [Gemmatimonadales bacterium]|nr:DUF1800 domain-containing protein [Gemmatimonadales bacterium]
MRIPLSIITTLTLATSLAAQMPPPAPPAPPAAAMTARDSALHALNRLAYGPRPGEVDSVARLGVMRWIDRQLDPDGIDDKALERREHDFKILDYHREDLAERFRDVQRERQRMQRELGAAADTVRPDNLPKPMREFRQLDGELQQLAVVRAALSERQLREVMVDFWTNHFNVFVGKGADRFLLPSYIEQTIRPRVLGRFEDLLIATAESPAMLFYLDNAQSVAPGSTPPRPFRPFSPFFGRRRFGMNEMPEDRRRRQQTGINENYARELLELHTLGVDGGYTQQDVIEVARIFTGWSIEPPERGAGFVFRDWAHDQGTKHVFGLTFQEDGKDEGVRLLKFLAMQHATMHHVSAKLCARFVADEPPDGCVDAAVAAWQKTRGDIRAVLRAIVTSPDFWAPQVVRSKVKTPFEFVVSAVRAVSADPDTTPRLAQVVARLGEPLYQQPAPTGYGETEAHWVNSGALLARMNAAVALAGGHLPGIDGNLDAVIPATTDHSQLVDMVDKRILGGTMSAHTRIVILKQLTDVADPLQARALAVGLAIGGPDFQKQ